MVFLGRREPVLTPEKGKPRLKKAIAEAFSPSFGKTLNPDTEVTITTGANEG
jgi:kynurenine aminotransferase